MWKKTLMFVLACTVVLSSGASAMAAPFVWESEEAGDHMIITAEVPYKTEEEVEEPDLKEPVKIFTVAETVKEPTCTEAGLAVKKDKAGKVVEEIVLAKKPHEYGEWQLSKEPTCKEQGIRYRVCRNCGGLYVEKLPIAAHKFEDWEILEEATENSAGERKAVCSVCGIEKTEKYYPEGTLKKGDSGKEVKAMQEKLAEQHFLNHRYVDGSFGSITEQAVKAFQKEAGETADGIAWPKTIALMDHEWSDWEIIDEGSYRSPAVRHRVCEECGMEETEEVGCLLYSGAAGDNVKKLQKELAKMGYDVMPDGEYGSMTRRAVRAYQEKNGMETDDGVVWPGVWNSIFPIE